MSAALWLGLLSALSYGITDYVSRVTGRALGTPRALLFGQLVALLGVSVCMAVNRTAVMPGSAEALTAAVAALGSSVFLVGASIALNQALVIGPLAVTAPIGSSYGAVTTLLTVAAGEPLKRAALGGIALIVAGACVVSIPATRERSRHSTARGLWLALLAAAGYGVGFWIQSRWVVPRLGAWLPVWLTYALAVLFWALAGRMGRFRPEPPAWREAGPVLIWGLSSVVGFIALSMGLRTGASAVVVVLNSAASAVTVFLGCALDRTRVAVHQWAALAMIVVGLGLVRA